MEMKRTAKKIGNSAFVNVGMEFLGKELIVTDEVKQSINREDITLAANKIVEMLTTEVRAIVREELERMRG